MLMGHRVKRQTMAECVTVKGFVTEFETLDVKLQ